MLVRSADKPAAPPPPQSEMSPEEEAALRAKKERQEGFREMSLKEWQLVPNGLHPV